MYLNQCQFENDSLSLSWQGKEAERRAAQYLLDYSVRNSLRSDV